MNKSVYFLTIYAYPNWINDWLMHENDDQWPMTKTGFSMNIVNFTKFTHWEESKTDPTTHDKCLTHGHRKLRPGKNFEMLRLTPDFEPLRLTCDFKTMCLMPARGPQDARNQASSAIFQNHASHIIFCDHASDVQYASSYVYSKV